jgi:hypothetical protein
MGIGGFIKHTMFGVGAADHGSVPVPGSAQVELPAGTVRLTYQEAKRSRNDAVDGLNDIQFSAPIGLEVAVTPAAGGAPLAISGPGLMGMGTHKSTKGGQSRDEIGTVEVTQPGSYTITAATPSPLTNAVEPQILIGS